MESGVDATVNDEIIESLRLIPQPSAEQLNAAKLEICRKYHSARLPANSELLVHVLPHEVHLKELLRRKATRRLSGVIVVAVMTEPRQCPHSDAPCAYCPGGPQFGSPQSYTGKEPAAMRGSQSGYDPFQQVQRRIDQFRAIGHETDKVELIIMGGTFPSAPHSYQEWFVKRCLDALNGIQSKDLEGAKELASNAPIHNVGITVETRPDWSKQLQIDQMLKMGVTRVELGVQTIYDDIYRLVKRGHTVKDVTDATRACRDSGLKVCYHMMPGLPGSDYDRDLAAFEQIFNDEHFRPDMLKIYPCLVLRDTKTYEWWRERRYSPMTTEDAVRLIVDVKKRVPRWVRIMRIQRDIPANLIEAGVKRSDLRELVRREMERQGLRCRCIRCREIGRRSIRGQNQTKPENFVVQRTEYEGSEGKEFFVSIDDHASDSLIGFLRLRIPSHFASRPEIRSANTAVVRELHIYGGMVPVGDDPRRGYQHLGYGERLLTEAEEISRVTGKTKILVTSGLGTRQYYSRLGYSPDGPYMAKTL